MNHRSRARVALRLLGGVMPLQQPLRVRERPVLLDVRGGGEEEHLGGDVLGAHLARVDLGAVLPPGGALDQREVAHDQPLEVGHADPLHAVVGRADGGVLAHQEVALALALELGHDRVVGGV